MSGESSNPFADYSAAPAAPSNAGSGIQWGASNPNQSAWASSQPAYDVETTYVPPSQSDVVAPAWGQASQGAWASTPAASPSTMLLPPSTIPSDATVPAIPSTTAQLAFTESTAAPVAKGTLGSGGSAWGRDNGGSAFQPTPSTSGSQPLLSQPQSSSTGSGGEDASKYAFYNIRRYRPYFDIDTTEVLWRVTSSFIGAFKPDFMQVTHTQPDLYGPFWVTTTLIFVTAAAGNYSSYVAWKRQQENEQSDAAHVGQWFADATKLGTSAAIFYGYAFVVSLALWFWVRMLKGDVKLVNMFCIYGYALTIFIPISILCIVPVEAVRWVFVALATLLSGGFLLMNLRDTVSEAGMSKSVWLLGAIVLLHLGLGVALKLFFFKY